MTFVSAGRIRPSPALRPVVAALALALGTGLAQAQSLVDVYAAARGYDPTYLGARALADSAQYRAEQAHAGRRPGLNLVVSGTHAVNNTPDSLPTSAGSTTIDGRLAAQQSLFNRPLDLQIDQADKGIDAARASLQLAEQDLIVRVAQAYFDVLSSAEALTSVQANEKAIEQQLASAKRNFEVGNATITDTREAEARYDLARAQEIAARNDLETKKVTLDQLVGRNGVAPQPLAAPVVLPAVLPSQASDWVRMAEADNASLKLAQLNYEVAKLTTSEKRAGHLPTVGLTAGYVRSHAQQNFSNALVCRDGQCQIVSGDSRANTNGGSIAVTVTVPLFAGYAIENRVKEAVLLEEKARNDFETAHSAATLGTRTAFLGAQSGSAQVKALEAAEVSSKLALEATELGYKVGVKVNIDVLNAQSQLYQTRRDLAKARYDYLLATLKLRQAAGQLKADDLLAINALLAR